MTITRRRKKPVEVDTVQWTGHNEAELIAFTEHRFESVPPEDRAEDPEITAQVFDVLHSTWVGVCTGQHIVRGVKGEFYPIAEDVLAETYELAMPDPAATEATEPEEGPPCSKTPDCDSKCCMRISDEPAGESRVTVYGIDVTEWDRIHEVLGRIETAVTGWRAQDHTGHGSPCENSSDGTCSQPARYASEIGAADESADMVRKAGALRGQIATAVRSVLYRDLPGDMGEHVADAVLLAVLPHGKFLGDQLRHSEGVIERVIALHARWVQAGPPPLGASMARWWDTRIVELHDAIVPPADQTEQTAPVDIARNR